MAWQTSDLDRIDAAIASGELVVRFADRSVEYRSIPDLLRAREAIVQSLATKTGNVQKRQIRLYTKQGW